MRNWGGDGDLCRICCGGGCGETEEGEGLLKEFVEISQASTEGIKNK